MISVMWVDFSVIKKMGPHGRRIPFPTTISAPASSTDAGLTCLHHPSESCSQTFLSECVCLSLHISQRTSDSPDHPEQYLPPWIILLEDALGDCIELELQSFNFPHPEFPLGGSATDLQVYSFHEDSCSK